MSHRDTECECYACKYGEGAAIEREIEATEKYGWFIHMIRNDDRTATGVNYHTHGLDKKYQHPDIQIVFPMGDDAEMIGQLLWCVADLLEEGQRFKAGDTSDKVVRNHIVLFANATEGDRKVLRVIMPDPAGKCHQWEMAEPYAEQWEGASLDEV